MENIPEPGQAQIIMRGRRHAELQATPSGVVATGFWGLMRPWLLCGFIASMPLFFLLARGLAASEVEVATAADFFRQCWVIVCEILLKGNYLLAITIALSSGYICSAYGSKDRLARFIFWINMALCILFSTCIVQDFNSPSMQGYLNVVGMVFTSLSNLFGFYRLSRSGERK